MKMLSVSWKYFSLSRHIIRNALIDDITEQFPGWANIQSSEWVIPVNISEQLPHLIKISLIQIVFRSINWCGTWIALKVKLKAHLVTGTNTRILILYNNKDIKSSGVQYCGTCNLMLPTVCLSDDVQYDKTSLVFTCWCLDCFQACSKDLCFCTYLQIHIWCFYCKWLLWSCFSDTPTTIVQ